jgi:hypothetical protein
MDMHTAVSRPSSAGAIGVLFAWMALVVLPPNASGQPGSNPPPQPFSFLPAGHVSFQFQTDMDICSFSLIVGPAGDLTIFDAVAPFVDASGSCDLMTDMCTAMGPGGANYQLMLPSMTFSPFTIIFNNGAGARSRSGGKWENDSPLNLGVDGQQLDAQFQLETGVSGNATTVVEFRGGTGVDGRISLSVYPKPIPPVKVTIGGVDATAGILY